MKRKLFRKQATFLNYKIANLFIKIDETLPSDAWLTEVNILGNNDFKTLQVMLKGSTMSSDPLNTYVKELNTQVEAPPLNPSIQPQQKDDKRYFTYTLTNVDNTKKGPEPLGGAMKL